MSNYFQKTGYASNSTLTQFGVELGILQEFTTSTDEQRYENFRQGTIFDALATEPEKLNLFKRTISGTDYTFTKEELDFWQKKKDLLFSKSFFKNILSLNPSFQKEFYIDDYSLDGIFPIKMKGKLDMYLPNLVIDLKTTSATNERQFKEVCEQHYYRQMLYYMHGTGAENALLIGVSKTKNEIFKVNFGIKHAKYKETLEICKLLIQKWAILK